MKKIYILEVEIETNYAGDKCQQCPCLTYDLEFGYEYCNAGEGVEYPQCIKGCPLKEK